MTEDTNKEAWSYLIGDDNGMTSATMVSRAFKKFSSAVRCKATLRCFASLQRFEQAGFRSATSVDARDCEWLDDAALKSLAVSLKIRKLDLSGNQVSYVVLDRQEPGPVPPLNSGHRPIVPPSCARHQPLPPTHATNHHRRA